MVGDGDEFWSCWGDEGWLVDARRSGQCPYIVVVAEVFPGCDVGEGVKLVVIWMRCFTDIVTNPRSHRVNPRCLYSMSFP
jgi:hypothetical protein